CLPPEAMRTLVETVSPNLVANPKVIGRRLREELPFMPTENIMMDAVKRGGNRQELHELIRVHSVEAARQVKEHGKPNDLLERIAGDKAFDTTVEKLTAMLDPSKYTGRSEEQNAEFLAGH